MGVFGESKIGKLLLERSTWELYFSEWLIRNGYSSQLMQKYIKGGWIKSLCRGVFYASNKEVINAYGAIRSYYMQVGQDVHVAAHSALEIYGFMHYVPMGKPQMMVSVTNDYIPMWLKIDAYDRDVVPFASNALPIELHVGAYQNNMLVSAPERAFMECLLLAPKYYNYLDLYLLMEQLTGLRANVVQQLLVEIKSYRVKRMFAYMAEKAKHLWWEDVDLGAIDMGRGKIYYNPTGKFIAKYKITIPLELYEYE